MAVAVGHDGDRRDRAGRASSSRPARRGARRSAADTFVARRSSRPARSAAGSSPTGSRATRTSAGATSASCERNAGGQRAVRAGRAAPGGRRGRRAHVRERRDQRHLGGALRHQGPRPGTRTVPLARRGGSRGAGRGDRGRRRRRAVPRASIPSGTACGSAGRGFEVIGAAGAPGHRRRRVARPLRLDPARRHSSASSARPTALQVFARESARRGRSTAAEDRARATMRARRQLRPGIARHLRRPHAGSRARLRRPDLASASARAAVPISIMALLAAIVVVDQHDARSVAQRTREIGVRRAVGAAAAPVVLEMLAESTLIALAGGAVGLRRRAGARWRRPRRRAVSTCPLAASTAAWSLAAAAASGLRPGGTRPGARPRHRRRSPRIGRSEPDRRLARPRRALARTLSPSRRASPSTRSATSRRGRSLAMLGIVIGIVTVVLVASVLVNVRNQVALLFRELGTENVFAFHLTGDPYAAASEKEARRKPLEAGWRGGSRAARAVDPGGGACRSSSPAVVGGRALIGARRAERVRHGARRGRLVELLRGGRRGVRDGPSVHRPRGSRGRAGRRHRREPVAGALRRAAGARAAPLTLAGESYTSSASWSSGKGGFFGENRQDSVLAIPAGTAQRRFAHAGARRPVRAREAGRGEPRLRRGRSDPPAAAAAAARMRRTTSRSRRPSRSSVRSTR